METILDHNPTDQELEILYGRIGNRVKEIARNSDDQDNQFLQIARLMVVRGDETAKDEYIEKIESSSFRYSGRMLVSKLA